MKILELLVIAVFVMFGQYGTMSALADTYTYDPLNRLIQVVYEDRSSVVYTYDAGGNITQILIPGPVNGACGASNGQTFTVVPSTNLCSPDVVVSLLPTATGWNWICQGTNGGTDANCSASIQTYLFEAILAGNGGGSISSTPSGISCMTGSLAGCSTSFAFGTAVILTAIPDVTTSIFSGWGGACTTEPCEITVNANKNAVATFSLVPRSKLTLGDTTGFETLQLAYGSAMTTIFALDGLFSGDWLLDKGKDIFLKGGYLSNYGPNRNGFSVLNGKLTVQSGSLKADKLKVGH